MALQDFLDDLEALATAATTAFESASDATELEAARVEYIGAKGGKLKTAQKGLGQVDKADKPVAGKTFNEIKQKIEQAFKTHQTRLAGSGKSQGGKSKDQFDPSLPGTPLAVGSLHPITQTIEELKDIMGRLGFTVADGPEIEDEEHNFNKLNIPREHPARDPLDNF